MEISNVNTCQQAHVSGICDTDRRQHHLPGNNGGCWGHYVCGAWHRFHLLPGCHPVTATRNLWGEHIYPFWHHMQSRPVSSDLLGSWAENEGKGKHSSLIELLLIKVVLCCPSQWTARLFPFHRGRQGTWWNRDHKLLHLHDRSELWLASGLASVSHGNWPWSGDHISHSALSVFVIILVVSVSVCDRLTNWLVSSLLMA